MDFAERRFAAPSVQINYAEGPPNGPAFVALHGGGGRWQYCQPLIEALAVGWHTYAPDFRGHGGSGRVPGAYALRDYVGDVAAFIEGAVAQPAVVFGHSLGGEVGVMLAAERPELVRALIVGDAPLDTRRHITDEPRHHAQNELFLRLAGRPIDEIEAALLEMPLQEPGARTPRPAREVMGRNHPWFRLHAATLHTLDPEMLVAVQAGPESMLVGYDPRVLLPAIACPVLLLQADPMGPMQGGVMRDEHVALGLSLIRRATHVRLSGIGHPLQDTPAVLEAITPFLESVRG